MPQIDDYSRTTVPIRQNFRGAPLGNATGFVWFEHGRYYLITNWHVASMIDPNTGENLHSQGGRPDSFDVQFNPRRFVWGKINKRLPIRDADDRPLWLIHPVHKRSIDVIALPLEPPDSETDYCAIKQLQREDQLLIAISMDVFVLGYPFGADPPGFPIWKRGSIASEPQLSGLTKHYFLIDTGSRPGMSGGPVIRRSWGVHVKEDYGVSMTGGSATKFVGIYSGRLKTIDPLEAQIGMVWPEALIHDIVAAGMTDEPL